MDSIVKTGIFEYQGKDYTFNYFTDIDISKKILFVNGVVDTIVTEKHYQSLLRGLIFGFQIINVFSDALSNFKDTNGDEKKLSLLEIEDVITNTKIVDIIMTNAKTGLIDELQEAVDKDIEYKTGIHRNPVGEAVAGLLNTLEQRVKDVDIDDLMGFVAAFKGVSSDDMTPERLWDAYAESKAFKKVIESREKIDKIDEKQSDKIVKLADKVGKQPKKRGGKSKTKKEEAVVENKKDRDE